MSAFGRSITLPAIALVCVFAGCGPRSAAPPASRTDTAAAAAGRAVAPASASPEDDGQWTMPAKDYVATLLQAAVLWLWHAPALFDLALDVAAWHIAQHLSFLVTALVFWEAMVGRGLKATGVGVAAVCLFATSIATGALGALMAFSQSPWYARYAELGLAPFGLSPTEDQQLAGLIMWIPGGVVHAAAALVLVARALDRAGRARPAEAAA